MPQWCVYISGFVCMIAAANFWPDFMKNEAGNLLCTYLAERGGGALGAFAGGAIGSYFGPGGTKPGIGIGSALGGAGGAALGAAFCPTSSPENGQFPFKPAPIDDPGKCSGIGYTYNYTIGQYSGITGPGIEGTLVNQQNYTTQLTGPISEPTLDYFSTNSFSGTCRGFNYRWRGFANGAPFDLNLFGATQRDGNPVCPPVYRLLSASATRNDGLPDECGNFNPSPNTQLPSVPDQIPPFRDDPFARRPINIDVDFGGGDTVNIDGDIILDGPNIGPNGDLEICYTFEGLRFCIGTDGPPRIGPGDRNSGDPADQPPPTDDPARVLAGVFYEVTTAGAGQSFETIGGEKYFYPRFGSVTFTGLGEQSQPIEMRSEKGYVKNPAPSVFSTYFFDAYQQGNGASFRDLWEKECQIPTPEITE